MDGAGSKVIFIRLAIGNADKRDFKLEGIRAMKYGLCYNMDCLQGLAELAPESVDLIIADPPYFRIKGEFDFKWATIEEYLSEAEQWAKAFKRVLKDSGTLYIYGHAKRIAYLQVLFDSYFNLENSLVWRKKECQTNRGAKNYRCFAPVTERILFYSKEVNKTGLEKIKHDLNNFAGLRAYFAELQKLIGATKKQIIDDIGQRADHCFRHSSAQWDLPTSETYSDIISFYRLDGMREYEEQRREYEEQRRYFKNPWAYTDVLDFSQEAHITGGFDHDTKKPETLTRCLILASSRKGSRVLVPFSGSGTEMAMAIKEGRQAIGFDINPKYVDMTNERIKRVKTNQLTMF